MKKNQGILAACMLILFSVYVYVSSFSITSTANAALGPAFMPQVVSAILFILGCINLVFEIKEAKNGIALDGDRLEKKGWKIYVSEHIDYISGLLLLVYVFSIKPLGFLISSCLYMFAHMLLLTVNTKRNYIKIVLLAVIAPSIIYFGFVKIFYLMLPPGILG